MINKPKKYIIDVIPLTRIPLNRQQHFSYLFDKKVLEGSLVSIPLFRRNVEGIAIRNRTDFHRFGNIKLKGVNEIVEKGFLIKNQIELAKFISDYYICPLGIVLKSFIPKRMKARKKKHDPVSKQVDKIILTSEQKNAISQISKNNGKYYLFGPASSGKTEVYIELIKKLKKDEQTLVLVPELTLTSQAIERYGQYFANMNIAVLTSKITKGQFYEDWQNIKSGKARIIIGTRMAILAPFKKLKLIVIDEEQDMSFKQWDMNPRYDARSAAEKLVEISKATLVMGSATPRIESFYKSQKGEYELIKLPKLKKYAIPRISVIDMKKEKWKKNHSPISEQLRGEIEYALKNKLQSILFINRQGVSSFSVCMECKEVLKCPKCERALIYMNSGEYHCLHCNYKTDALASCSKCKSMTFKNIGIGTQKIEREIKNNFPGANIKRVDFESMKKSGDQEKLYRDFSSRKIDILIGTQMITKGWDLPNVGLIGIIDADSLLDFPDFRTDEKAFQNIVQVSGRTSRPESRFPGRVIIQTYNPESNIIQVAATLDYDKFFSEEIEERKLLHYPPFSMIIKLVYRNRNKASLEKTAEKICNELKELNIGAGKVIISNPQDPLISQVRGIFKKQIIIKVKSNQGEVIKKLENYLKKLGSDWIIDIDPIAII